MVSSSTGMAATLAVITVGVLLILLGPGVSMSVLLRIGLRNMLRRRVQTLLLLCGLTLSTAVITAAFGLQDSFLYSALTYRLAALGSVDESVTGTFTPSQVTADIANLQHNRNVQAVVGISYYQQSLNAIALRTGFGVHNVDVYALPPAFDQVYGSLHDEHGQVLHIADLRVDEVFVNPSLAQNLSIRAGDTLQLTPGGTVTVRAVLSHDLAVTGPAITQTAPEVIMPLLRMQRLDPSPPDAICIRNVGSPTQSDSGTTRSQAIDLYLERFFRVPIDPSLFTSSVFRGGATTIYPLKPTIVETQLAPQFGDEPALATIGQQFSQFPALFTCLLVGAGMLLLALLMLLLGVERRAEMGMMRALGLQRRQMVYLWLFEGGGYGIVGAFLGLPVGAGITALELMVLSRLPRLDTGIGGNPIPISIFGPAQLSFQVSWQSFLSAWCIGFLTTLATVLIIAFWISHATIARALRDLDDPPGKGRTLAQLWLALREPLLDSAGRPLPATHFQRFSRCCEIAGLLLWEICRCDLLCLLSGSLLLFSNTLWKQDVQLVQALLFAGGGLLIMWVFSYMKLPWFSGNMIRRLSFSLIGAGWLFAGISAAAPLLSLFQTETGAHAFSIMEALLCIFLLVSGAVLLAMANVDLLIVFCSLVMRHIHSLAAIHRISLIYPLSFRLRTGLTILLLCTITFMILLLVTTNLGALQEAQATINTGGFPLEADVFGSQLASENALASQLQALQTHRLLSRDFTQVAVLHLLYLPFGGITSLPLTLADHPAYPLTGAPAVADDTFLSSTTLPLLARAQGYTSDRQVWDAVRDQAGYAVLTYDPQLVALPVHDNFIPFSAMVPESKGATAPRHAVTVIGLTPASTFWKTLFLSTRTAVQVAQTPYVDFMHRYLFRLRPGVSETQAARDLSRALDGVHTGIVVLSLDQSSTNEITALLTLFLSSYLALGLLFGAMTSGIIASRAVVERRQQIGMLRALGFSRSLIRRSFFLESGFVVALSLLIGTVLALYLAYQTARTHYLDFPLPVLPIVMILLGSFAITFVGTTLPAQQAARLHPAEALRYE